MSIRSKRLGTFLFWVTYPAIWIILHNSHRTRLLLSSGSQLLVTKTWLGDNRWSLPGGGLHKNESPEEGILRELKEETGLELSTADISYVDKYLFEKNGIQFTYSLFKSVTDTVLEVRPQPVEVDSVMWIERSELNPQNAAPDVMQALQTWPL